MDLGIVMDLVIIVLLALGNFQLMKVEKHLNK